MKSNKELMQILRFYQEEKIPTQWSNLFALMLFIVLGLKAKDSKVKPGTKELYIFLLSENILLTIELIMILHNEEWWFLEKRILKNE